MKITNIETFIVDAGWRPWGFVKVETDEGITGWGECSDGRSPRGVQGTIEDLKPLLIGTDPREFEIGFGICTEVHVKVQGGLLQRHLPGWIVPLLI